MGWQYLGILFAVCAALCAVGFYRFVYFLSIGYGFAVAGAGIAVLILVLANGWHAGLFWLLFLQVALFVFYGARLSGFLLIREIKNAAYRKTLREATGNDKKLPFFVLLTIWIFVSALYTAQVTPVLYRYMNGAKDVAVPLIGIAISVCGLLLESAADRQKSAQKKKRPDMVATEGLYRLVRCPNYFGEIVFWTGVFVSGTTGYRGAGQWILAVIALAAIVYIMFNGAQRLEKRQESRYGGDPAYRAYADKTPIILPFVPIYHLTGGKKEKK